MSDPVTHEPNKANVTLPVSDPPAPPASASKPTFTAPPTSDDTISEAAKKLLAESKEEAETRRAEAKRLAKERDDLKARLDAIESEKMAEQGKYKELYEKEVASRKQLEGRVRERAIRAEIRAVAAAEGLMDLDAADLISSKSVKVNDDTGDFEGIREAVLAHKEAKPHWYRMQDAVRQAAPVPAPTTGSISAPPAEPARPLDVRTLSKEDYARRKQEMLSSLRRK